MSFFDIDSDDFGYNPAFDYDHDGELNSFERYSQFECYTSPCGGSGEEDEEEREYELALSGLDEFELADMDEDERREALEDAGLDPDEYDF